MLRLFLPSTPHLGEGRSPEAPRTGPGSGDQLRRGGVGRAGGERWTRIVLDLDLAPLCHFVPARPPTQPQGRVEAGRTPSRGGDPAVDDVPLVGYMDVDPGERLARQPMCGCSAPLQPPRLREEQRAGAD